MQNQNKIITSLLFMLLCSISLYSQGYYYNKGEKVPVRISEHKNYYLFFDANIEIDNLRINSQKVFNKELNWAFGSKFEESEPRHCEKLRSNFVAIQSKVIDCRATLAMTDYKKNVTLHNYNFFIVLIFENIFNYIKRF